MSASNSEQPPPPAGAVLAPSPSALDLDVVLLQMSRKFNSDLDGRSGAAGGADGAADAHALASASAARAAGTGDQTRKWRGLLKNKFAATASRRGGAGGRGKERRTQRRRNAKPPVAATVTALAVMPSGGGDDTPNAAVAIEANEPAAGHAETVDDAAEAGATPNVEGGAVAQPGQLQSKRVLRRHANTPSAPSPSTPAKRQGRARSGRSSVTAVSSSAADATEAAAAAADVAAEPAVRRKGRPRRVPQPRVTAALAVAVASDEPATVTVGASPFEPKKLRSHRTTTTVTDEKPYKWPADAESRAEDGAAAELVSRSETETDAKEAMDCKPPISAEKKEEEAALVVDGQKHADVDECELVEMVQRHDVGVVAGDVGEDDKGASALAQAVLDTAAKLDVVLVKEAVAAVVVLPDGVATEEILSPDEVKLEEIPAVIETMAATEAVLPSPATICNPPATTAVQHITAPPTIAAVVSPPPLLTLPLAAAPKKRGRKPGYRKPIPTAATATSTKKNGRQSRDTDPAFDPPVLSASSRLAAAAAAANNPNGPLAPSQRLSRRIKPTAKILANDELRYGFELQNNARLSLSSEHLDERSPTKEESAALPPMPAPMRMASSIRTVNSPLSNGSLAPLTSIHNGHAAEHAVAAAVERRRPAPCRDPVEFLHAIKQARINLHRSPEDNIRRLSVKQKRRLFKRKEKHLHKLGLQRRHVGGGSNEPTRNGESNGVDDLAINDAALDDDEDNEDDDDEEDFVPAQKIIVSRPSVTLRLRANTQCGEAPGAAATATSASAAKKRTYAVVQSSTCDTSLILSAKQHSKRNASEAAATGAAAAAAPAVATAAVVAAIGPATTGSSGGGGVQQPATICLCDQPSHYYSHRTAATMHCRAVDEIAGQRIGCCHLAATTRSDNDVVLLNLRRPSVRVAYAVLCESHQQRLAAHHSCAGCGVFCTHGRFAMCAAGRHLFHRECATKFIVSAPATATAVAAATSAAEAFVGPQLVLRCPHCGTDVPERETIIEMRLNGGGGVAGGGRLPVFVPDQRRPVKQAKMSIGAHTYASAAAAAVRGGGAGAAAGSGGRMFSGELEKLIPAHVQDVVLRAQRAADAAGAATGVCGSKDMIKAIGEDDLERAVRIIASGYDITAPLAETRRGTSLHLVASCGSLAMTYLILSRAPPPLGDDFLNRRDRELRTALMCAVLGAKNDTIRLLVQCGADVTARGPGGMTALHLAAKTGNFAAAQILLDAHRRATSVHRFGLFVNAVDDGGWTTIVWAAEIGHAEMVEFLVQCGADLAVCDAERNTVLHWAALSDDVATVRPLLLGADLNVQNVNGDTPLHIACRNSNTRMCLIFLAHGASLQLHNDLGETAFDGIQDAHGSCARAVQFNMQLRALARFEVPTVVCQDISKGREAYPIKVIRRQRTGSPAKATAAAGGSNAPAGAVPPFQYITQSIVLHSAGVQVDRRISQMRVCACDDNCTSASCRCSEISVQNWYNAEGRLNGSFNYADPAMIFECSDVCGCNRLLCRNRVVQRGQNVALQVVQATASAALGWTVSAVGDVARGTFVAEYTGELLTDAEAARRADSSYVFDLAGTQFCIDAQYYGNVSRFFNHSCEPNVVPIRVFYDHHDLRFPKIAFFAMRDIAADEEITFDYGEKFWLNRQAAPWRCECRTASCRFGASGQPAAAGSIGYRKQQKHKEQKQQQQPHPNPATNKT